MQPFENTQQKQCAAHTVWTSLLVSIKAELNWLSYPCHYCPYTIPPPPKKVLPLCSFFECNELSPLFAASIPTLFRGRGDRLEDCSLFCPCTCQGSTSTMLKLITLVWGLVMGHHHLALCCCQEPFTPSSSSPNGTSESIKTIITANPTESKEIILGVKENMAGMSGHLLDMHLARQPITVSIFSICLVLLNLAPRATRAWLWTGCCLGRQILHADLSWWAWAVVWWTTEIYVWLCWIEVQTLSTTVFFLPLRLNEPLSVSTQYLFSEDLHCASKRSMAGQCVFEKLSALPPDS